MAEPSAALAQQPGQHVEAPALGQHPVSEVRPIEAGDELCGFGNPQLVDDVPAHPLGRCGGESDRRHGGEVAAQGLEVAVVGPEVVPPLGYAVSLVNGDETELQGVEEVAEPGEGDALGGSVQDVEPAVVRLHLYPANLGVGHRAVDEVGGDATLLQGVDLVLHQGDQRRDDQGHLRQAGRREAGSRATCRCPWA